MRQILFIALLTSLIYSCSPTSPGTFNEISRVYCPDSTKFLLTYRYEQGAWDGSRTSMTTILKKLDSIPSKIKFSYSSLDFDNIYWKNDDTVIIVEKYTEFVSNAKSNLKDTLLNGVVIKVIQKDPIDSSFTRKILFRELSPNQKYDLVAYRYTKPVNGYYFLNISIIDKNDNIPKFGNFYVSRFDFDCFKDIRWNKTNTLDIKVSSSCFYSFVDYLVVNRPSIKYNLQMNDTIKGNITNN